MTQLRTWSEEVLAKATAGYDINQNRTLIKSFSLVVIGPDVRQEIVDQVRRCASGSLLLATGSFKATQGEIGTRVAAAYATFKASIRLCLSLEVITRNLFDQFEIAYVERAEFEDGLVLEYSIENQSAALYALIKREISVPEPINQIVQLYIATQDVPPIRLRVDDLTRPENCIAAMPEAVLLARYSIDATTKAREAGKQLVESAVAVQDAIQSSSLTALRLGEKASKDAIEACRELAGGFYSLSFQKLPQLVNNEIEYVFPSPALVKEFLPEQMRDIYGSFSNPIAFVSDLGNLLLGHRNSPEYWPVRSNGPKFDSPPIFETVSEYVKRSTPFGMQFDNDPKGTMFSIDIDCVTMSLDETGTTVSIDSTFNANTAPFAVDPVGSLSFPILFFRRRTDEEVDIGAEGARAEWKLLEYIVRLDWNGKWKARQNKWAAGDSTTRPLMFPRELFYQADMVVAPSIAMYARIP